MARAFALAVLLLLAACGDLKPFEYQTADERPGPGLRGNARDQGLKLGDLTG